MKTTVGTPLGAPGYRLIDADAHINEPADLWTSRLPAKFKDRSPRIDRLEKGDAWILDGVADPINFGLNAAAGLPVSEKRPWIRWEEVRAAGYDPKARLDEMDVDLVDATVLYPTPRLCQYLFVTSDAEFHLALIRAYNDWISEFASYDPSRLGGMMLVPNRGIDTAVAEVERMAGKPGIVGAMIGAYPHGDLDISEDDDRLWEAIVAAGWAVHIHIRLTDSLPVDTYAPASFSEFRARSALRFLDAPSRLIQFLESGVFNRVPDLHVVFAETDAGWVPYVKEQMDNRLLRRTLGSEMRGMELPSSQVEQHFSFTYISDNFGLQNRHAVGVERMMWSSDFPHSASDWPRSPQVISAAFAGVPSYERDLILAGNALQLYKFDRHN